MSEQFKRALWCRWFHRWRQNAGPQGGWSRLFCHACEDFDYGEAHMDRVRI